jgi:dGTPase
MRAFGDRFNHNLHALHIVEDFELRYARFPGLNLTFEVREGIVKHSRDFEPGERVEFDEYLPGLRPPLEAQLIDLADEVAYNTADLDDGFSAGMFTLADIGAAVPHYGVLEEDIAFQFPAAPQAIQFQEVLRRLIDLLASGLIEGTHASVESSGVQSVDDVRRHPERLVEMSAIPRETNRALKRFLMERVYSTPRLVAERHIACDGIARLFAFFLQHQEKLPDTHRERLETHPLHRVVCDYIAGMTDGFFRRTASRLLP